MLMGDVPIFVAHDSADVWARPDLFYLDEQAAARCRGGASRLFQRDGPVVGKPSLSVGGPCRGRLLVVGSRLSFLLAASTSSGSTTFAALRHTGKSPPDRPRPPPAAGCPDRGITSSRPCGGGSAHFPWWPKTWADHAGC